MVVDRLVGSWDSTMKGSLILSCAGNLDLDTYREEDLWREFGFPEFQDSLVDWVLGKALCINDVITVEGGRGVSQKVTFDDKGGWGVWHMMT